MRHWVKEEKNIRFDVYFVHEPKRVVGRFHMQYTLKMSTCQKLVVHCQLSGVHGKTYKTMKLELWLFSKYQNVCSDLQIPTFWGLFKLWMKYTKMHCVICTIISNVWNKDSFLSERFFCAYVFAFFYSHKPIAEHNVAHEQSQDKNNLSYILVLN